MSKYNFNKNIYTCIGCIGSNFKQSHESRTDLALVVFVEIIVQLKRGRHICTLL